MSSQQAVKRTPSQGFVYLFRAENGMYKLGQSFDPRRPMARFNTLPVAVSFVYQIESSDVNWLEKKLHRQYAAQRVRGEWFALTDADVADLARLTVCRPSEQHSLFDDLDRRGIGAKIEMLRDRVGLAQVDLAVKAGLPLRTLTLLEDGTNADPRVSLLAAVARALGVGLEELTGDPSAIPPARRRGREE